MPQLGTTQYYRLPDGFGGYTYTTNPWGGNHPYGYEPITKDQYIGGVESNLQKMLDLRDQYNWRDPVNYTRGESKAALAAGKGTVWFTGLSPTREQEATYRQQLADATANRGIYAPGYIGPGFEDFLPDAPNTDIKYQKPEITAQATANGWTQNPDGTYNMPPPPAGFVNTGGTSGTVSMAGISGQPAGGYAQVDAQGNIRTGSGQIIPKGSPGYYDALIAGGFTPTEATNITKQYGGVVPTGGTTGGGITRDLGKEQAWVNNFFQTKGRAPTPDEVNQGVYGTPNPNFNTAQGVPAAGGNAPAGGAPIGGGLPGQSGVPGQTGGQPSTGIPQLDAYLAELQKMVNKLTADGTRINPNIELTPAEVQKFLDEANTKIDPYYQNLYSVISEDVKRNLSDLQKSYDLQKQNIGAEFKQVLDTSRESRAGSGTFFSGGRGLQEQQLQQATDRNLQSAANQAASSAGSLLRGTEEKIGTTRTLNLGIPGINQYKSSTDTGNLSTDRGLDFFSPLNVTGSLEYQKRDQAAQLAQQQQQLEIQKRTINF